MWLSNKIFNSHIKNIFIYLSGSIINLKIYFSVRDKNSYDVSGFHLKINNSKISFGQRK